MTVQQLIELLQRVDPNAFVELKNGSLVNSIDLANVGKGYITIR